MPARKRSPWESVSDAIANSRTLSLRTATYLPHVRVHIDTILGAFLEAAAMRQLKSKLSYCIHELAGNAKKANTKRLYFKEKNLDIDDPADYTAGIGTFKTEMERFNCLGDAYSISQDAAEGAGLGIVMMLFMLKSLGFGSDAFAVHSAQGETVATLTLIDPRHRERRAGTVTA